MGGNGARAGKYYCIGPALQNHRNPHERWRPHLARQVQRKIAQASEATALTRNELYALHALHAPEGECSGRAGPDGGGRSFTGNPYDGHTLAGQLELVSILTEGTGAKPGQIRARPGPDRRPWRFGEFCRGGDIPGR